MANGLGLRVLRHSEIAMGPGRADLLDAMQVTGSISAAARRMGMSYRRARLLVDTMNSCFVDPVVSKEKDGVEGGGAALTPTGVQVLKHAGRKAWHAMRTGAKGADIRRLCYFRQ